MAAISSLHRVRRRRQSLIAQKLKTLLQRRRFQLLQRLRQLLKPFHPFTQFAQLSKSRPNRATPVEQPIHLLHDLAELAEFGKTFRDFLECFAFLRCQGLLHEKESIVEQRRDLRLNPFVFLDRALIRRVRRTSALRPFRLGFLESAANTRHRLQDRLIDFFQDVKHADLMPYAGKNVPNRLRIQIRAVRRDAAQQEFSSRENVFERHQEFADVVFRRRTVEDFVRQSPEFVIVDDGENAERSVVHFIDGDIPGELFKSSVEVIVGQDEQASFFPPPTRPSFGSWRVERKPDDPAKDANSPLDRGVRLRRRHGRRGRRRRWCSGREGRRGR